MHHVPDTEELVRRAASGEIRAQQSRLTRHRNRLKRLISIRMDRRMASRIDPSDVVQDTLVEAQRRLPEYLRQKTMPFYPWIRQLAIQQLVQQHRRHIGARIRSVRREEQYSQALPDHSAIELAVRVLANRSTPVDRVLREETRGKVKAILSRLSEGDREVLTLRFLEQLSTAETAAVLGLTLNGVKSKQARAIERFARLFSEDDEHE